MQWAQWPIAQATTVFGKERKREKKRKEKKKKKQRPKVAHIFFFFLKKNVAIPQFAQSNCLCVANVPENIVYADQNRDKIVIIDFGDAKEVTDESTHEDFGKLCQTHKNETTYTYNIYLFVDHWSDNVCVSNRTTAVLGKGNKEIIRKIIRGVVRFPTTIKVSEQCQDFIHRLLQKDPNSRMSAKEALQHPWIIGKDASDGFGEEALSNLAMFGRASQLKRLIVTTVTANLDKKHQKEYEKQFNFVDVNQDELIDWTDMQHFLSKLLPDNNEKDLQQMAKTIVHNISGNDDQPITKGDWNNANVSKLLSSDHLVARQFKSSH
ncbi:hypothetical protein RFI_19241 [Reticulomyxa filosa]|uniref:Protein kinase domain-containing protein n=1 Tax=Reticulomyxa filosa TaxID=46433 RepID=X6MVM8_RETFI|nr:hypothetical protein RFI_19241 [Reticulomyxa filosa]|eukprot:ETO18053.1 hypothetical protein RFI_19241 [Reticulomyxa filosa]